jgi:hypothetical protein
MSAFWIQGAPALLLGTTTLNMALGNSSLTLWVLVLDPDIDLVGLSQAMEKAWTKAIEIAPQNSSAWSNRGKKTDLRTTVT